MHLMIKTALKRIAAPLSVMLVLSACVVVDEGSQRPYPGPVHPQKPQMCTMEYAPVCGVRNNRERDFANSCQARAEGFRVVKNGTCSNQGNWGNQGNQGNWGKPERPTRPERPQRPYRPEKPNRPNDNWGNNHNRPQVQPPYGQQKACTREYAPVCASQGNRNQTFPNSCVAESAGFRLKYNGQCR